MDNDIKRQIENLSSLISENTADASLFFERGKLYWKACDKAAAMTDFNTALSLDPSSPAKGYLEMANDIMDFYNTDLYNP